jgi:hypothetical protein
MTLKDFSKNMEIIDSKELSKNIRKTNYDLGTDNVKYRSEAQGRFVKHKDVENVALNEKTMADLRKHHFNLGYLGYKKLSEYHDNFDNKHKPRSKKEKEEF